MVASGEFREDLLWRVSGKTLRLPALRERKSDIAELARYFFELEKPRRNKQVTEDAVLALTAHDWSGNVRELKRICEQVALHAPLPIVRAEDVHACLPHAINSATSADASGAGLDLSIGLTELLARFEARVLREALRHAVDVDQAAERIGISRSSMYKKLKDFGIERL
jgi:DNA-binding NtrC family response regulator